MCVTIYGRLRERFFYNALAHEAGIKVVRGGKILRMWKVRLKKKHTEEKPVIG